MVDVGAKILRPNGIGLLDKWVNKHMFFRIPHTQLQSYNQTREAWCKDIRQTGL